MAQKQTNQITKQKRVDECIEKILTEGCGWATYTNWAIEEYKCSRNSANEYWRDAWVRIKDIVEEKDLIKAEVLVTKLEMILENGNYQEQLKAIEQLRKMGGIDAVEKHEVKHSGNITFNFGGRIPVDPTNPDII